jgi:zinc protease
MIPRRVRPDRPQGRRASTALLCYVALWASGGALEAQMPPPIRDVEARMPPMRRFELPNGMRVLTVRDMRAPYFDVRLAVRSGWTAVPPSTLGISRLTSLLIGDGTPERGRAEVERLMTNAGLTYATGATTYGLATVNVDAAGLATTFAVRGLTPRLASTLSLLADLVRRPALRAEDVERRKREIVAVQPGVAGPAAVANQRVARALGIATVALRLQGDSSILRISRDQVAAFHAAHYVPNNVTLVVVSDLDDRELEQVVTREFGDWAAVPNAALPGTQPPPEAVHAAGLPAPEFIERPGSVQTAVTLGARLPGINDPEYPAAVLLHAMLDRRLTQNILSRHGWAYGVSGTVRALPTGGGFLANTNVHGDKSADAVREVLSELRRLGAEPVPPSELETIRGTITGNLILPMEQRAVIAERLVALDINGYTVDHWERFRRGLSRVTPEDIQGLARRYLTPDRLVWVAVGERNRLTEIRGVLARVQGGGAGPPP